MILKNHVVVISERVHNISLCLSYLEPFCSEKILIVLCPRSLPSNILGFSQLIHIQKLHASTLARIIDKYHLNNTSFIFCDNTMSMLTEKVISFLARYHECVHKYRLAFLPSPSSRKSYFDYLFNGVGDRSLNGFSKRLLKVLTRHLQRASFAFFSYRDDKTTYICPNYRILLNPDVIPVLPNPILKSSIFDAICILHGNEDIGIYRSQKFADCLKYMSKLFNVFIKPHPRASEVSLKILSDLCYCSTNIKLFDSRESTAIEFMVGVAIASSALYTFPFRHRTNLSLLFADHFKHSKRNLVNPYIYQQELAKFFRVNNVAFPTNMTNLKSCVKIMKESK